MSLTALQEVARALDSAISLASDAVKSAEEIQRAKSPELVKLVKVAHGQYANAAAALRKSGAFEENEQALITTLKQADKSQLLEMLEKLASRAVFPIVASDATDWNFVEQSESSRDTVTAKPTTLSIWKQAWEEAKNECPG